jgi:HAD domain in Swiss Army Knife RNA repair proteins
MRNSPKPLLFVDIDGVLSLFGFQSDRRPPGSWLNVEGIVHLISGSASRHLHQLAAPFDLVWCSGWEEKANEHLLAALVLPDALPFLTFPVREGTAATRHWKLDAIEAHAGDRPLAWIDDAHDDSCRAWADRRDAPTLLVATEPATGLTDAHVERLERWAAEVTPQAADRPRR